MKASITSHTPRAVYRASPLLSLMCLLILAGCDNSPIREVSGNVTLDGQPLETGEIQFVPIDPAGGPRAGSTIENGSFRIPAVAQGLRAGTEYRVEITSMEGSGQMVYHPNEPSGQRELLVNIIPERYNMESELRATISSSRNENHFDFDLQTDPN